MRNLADASVARLCALPKQGVRVTGLRQRCNRSMQKIPPAPYRRGIRAVLPPLTRGDQGGIFGRACRSVCKSGHSPHACRCWSAQKDSLEIVFFVFCLIFQTEKSDISRATPFLCHFPIRHNILSGNELSESARLTTELACLLLYVFPSRFDFTGNFGREFNGSSSLGTQL